jgi:hypothetical protein
MKLELKWLATYVRVEAEGSLRSLDKAIMNERRAKPNNRQVMSATMLAMLMCLLATEQVASVQVGAAGGAG